MTKQYLVETVTLVKRQYLVNSEDMVGAQDTVTMREVRPYDTHALDEIIIGSREVGTKIPEIDPIKCAKLEAVELDLQRLSNVT